VTNLRKMRKSFHGPRLGFSALVCVLACGSGDEEIGGVPDTPGSAETLAPRDDLRAPPAGDQLSPACDDTPLSTA